MGNIEEDLRTTQKKLKEAETRLETERAVQDQELTCRDKIQTLEFELTSARSVERTKLKEYEKVSQVLKITMF